MHSFITFGIPWCPDDDLIKVKTCRRTVYNKTNCAFVGMMINILYIKFLEILSRHSKIT
jgi:hypothetical protein